MDGNLWYHSFKDLGRRWGEEERGDETIQDEEHV
jgi:hypothetical protein